MDDWTPRGAAAGFELPPILKPLEPFRDSLVVISNLTAPPSNGSHATASGGWLTGTSPKRTDGPDFRAGTTIDQLVARAIGQDTTFPSLEVATEDFTGLVGACDPGYSCAYMNTLNWQTPTTPLPMEINPRDAVRPHVRRRQHARRAPRPHAHGPQRARSGQGRPG